MNKIYSHEINSLQQPILVQRNFCGHLNMHQEKFLFIDSSDFIGFTTSFLALCKKLI